MIQVPELKPVRDYSNIRKDALEPFLRAAAGSNEGLNQRAKEFREHAVRVLGPEVFKEDRAQLLEKLKDEARSWGLSFHSDPDKVIDFVAENPIALRLPLGKLLQVPASHSIVTGILADAIDSIVVRIVLNSSPEEIQQALQRAAGALGGTESAPFHALSPIDFGRMKKWPFAGLESITYQYLDKVVEDWGKSVPNIHRLVPDELHSFMISNTPRTDKLEPSEKLGLLKKSSLLALSKVAPLLKKMNQARNNVGDVVSAALDTAIHTNALKWLEEVGRSINWVDRFRGELQEETATPRVPWSPSEEEIRTKQQTRDDSPTRAKEPRDEVVTKIL